MNLLSPLSHSQTCKGKGRWLETETQEDMDIPSSIYKVSKVFKLEVFSQLFHHRKWSQSLTFIQDTDLDDLDL